MSPDTPTRGPARGEEGPHDVRVPAAPVERETSALLDELDALLQRMLALPVDGRSLPENVSLITVAEAAPEPLVAYSTPPPPPSPLVAPDDLFFQSLSGGQNADALAPPPGPPVSLGPLRAMDERSVPSSTSPPPLPPALAPDLLDLKGRTRPELPPSREPAPLWDLPWWAYPLAWGNTAFDGCTRLLGGPGRWLRGPSGKTLLGWAGLAMLAVAGGLALHDWFGWTW